MKKFFDKDTRIIEFTKLVKDFSEEDDACPYITHRTDDFIQRAVDLLDQVLLLETEKIPIPLELINNSLSAVRHLIRQIPNIEGDEGFDTLCANLAGFICKHMGHHAMILQIMRLQKLSDDNSKTLLGFLFKNLQNERSPQEDMENYRNRLSALVFCCQMGYLIKDHEFSYMMLLVAAEKNIELTLKQTSSEAYLSEYINDKPQHYLNALCRLHTLYTVAGTAPDIQLFKQYLQAVAIVKIDKVLDSEISASIKGLDLEQMLRLIDACTAQQLQTLVTLYTIESVSCLGLQRLLFSSVSSDVFERYGNAVVAADKQAEIIKFLDLASKSLSLLQEVRDTLLLIIELAMIERSGSSMKLSH